MAFFVSPMQDFFISIDKGVRVKTYETRFSIVGRQYRKAKVEFELAFFQ